ncbi:long-chain-alcohol oxidase FAO4A-like [Teratosphaeria destructans]|uniref:Long-chain-alcohol oxidase n=1 Tax=Teratosphaeria destructans TaxID=418781 RepID=A0A9W7SKJ0_9PEZI|nr:long-chain-alcohol oxidase FAO4A-like [Teratosphaeria destructans]
MAISGLAEERIRQKPSPLPPLPDHDALSAEQWTILLAIADAVIPCLTSSGGNRLLQHPLRRDVYEASSRRLEQVANFEGGRELVSGFLGESASSFQAFRTGISRTINIHLPEQARKELLFVLSALNTRAGSLALTGHVSPLNTLPVQTRERILQGWATARLPLYRTLYKSLTALVKLQWVRNSPSLGRMLSYPKTPVHDSPPGTFFPFTFVQIPPSSAAEPETIETDVVIIGSGCGGAVAAKTLAEAGLRVIVTDRSYYWPPEHLPMSEVEGTSHMFIEGAALQSDEGSIAILGGSAWGGGGTINWSASLQTQGMVRREWAQKFGLPHFTSSAFQADLDAVCQRMGAGTSAIEHNKGNRALLDGARKLGWNVEPVPQNTGGEAHNCGYCTLGCGSCGKKGPTETFLPDAAKAGATFLEGFDVRQVLFSEAKGSERVATGVRGVWTGRDSNGGVAGRDRTKRDVIIKAPRVIVSAGTLASPLVLLRSGLKNPHIGRHLHLHPVSFTTATWDEDVRPWEGPILTAVVHEFENLDGDGYGPKLEATTMLPGLFLPLLPWKGGMQYKELCAKMKKMTGYISLTRDRYGGRVYPDPVDGRVRVQYNPSKYDRKHILEGVIRLAEIMYVEGAREISAPGCPHLEPFIRPRSDEGAAGSAPEPSVNNAEFQAWIQRLRTMGLPDPDAGFASAHQMGTCRMGTSPQNSVIDPRGQVWGTKGLYVADASALPSASGVNPMVTTMAIARGVARNVLQDALGIAAGPARARL